MSRRAYFPQYTSPNIIVLPIVYISPPTEQIEKPTNISLSCGRRSASVIRRNSVNFSNLKEIVVEPSSGGSISSAGASVNPDSQKFQQQDTNTMDHPSPSVNANPSIKELSSSKYKSRNNLVDFTGFNLLKRDGISLKKNKNDPRINRSIQRKDINESTNQNQRDAGKIVITSKESTEPHDNSKKSIDNIQSNKSNQGTTVMKDGMEKYFEKISKRNMDKKVVETKEPSKQGRPVKDPKRNIPKDKAKDLALPSQSKIKPKSGNLDAKRLESKSKDSKRESDYKSKSKSSSRTKSEKLSISGKKTTSSKSLPRTNKSHLSSKDIKQHKDLKNQNDSKPKKSKIVEQKSIKLNKIATIAKKSIARKQIETPKVTSKEKKVSTKFNTKKEANTVSKNKDVVLNKNKNEKQDLKPKQSRKRTKSGEYKEQDSKVVTVEQGIEVSPMALAKYVASAKKPKPKKYKRIKLVINIECPDSGDSDESSGSEYDRRSPDDLSFLDDFDVDEIVQSLNSCRDPIECNTMVAAIENANNENIEQNTQQGIFNDIQVNVISDIKQEVILITSDSENDDLMLEKGYQTTRNDGVKSMEIDENKYNKTFITNNAILKESNKTCRQLTSSHNDLNVTENQLKNSNHSFQTDNTTLTKVNQRVKIKIPLQKNSDNFKTPSECDIKNESINQSDDIKPTGISSPNKKDEIEMSLETMFNAKAPKFEIINNHPPNALNTYIKPNLEITLPQSDDIIESSLKTMLNITEDNEVVKIDDKTSVLDGSDVKEETIPSQNPENNIAQTPEVISDSNQCIKSNNDSVPVSVINNEQIKVEQVIEDKEDVRLDVKPVIDHIVKEETKSLQNTEGEITASQETFTGDNQYVGNKKEITPVIIMTENMNEADSAANNNNNLPLNSTRKDLIVNEESVDTTEKNVVNTNTNNNFLQISKQEHEDTKISNNTLIQPAEICGNNIENFQLKIDANPEDNFKAIKIEKRNINETIGEESKLNESKKDICTEENDIKKETPNNTHNSITFIQTIETTVVDAKLNTTTENKNDANEQNNNLALKPINTVTETSLNKEESQKLIGIPGATITQNKTISNENPTDTDAKAHNTSSCCKNKSKGFNNINNKLSKNAAQVTSNNNTVAKPNNKMQSVASSVGKSNRKSNTQECSTTSRKLMSSKQFMANLEYRMFEYLHAKFKMSSVICDGYFSTIYKCVDEENVPFAVKVLKHPNLSKGQVISKMLTKAQNYISINNTNVLYMINDFAMGHHWCFLTEYYTRNLKQAMSERKHTFHINVVQKLAMQLVSAVTMLTNNNIIHADIKPSHILLNGEYSRLKLCGFDRIIYSDKVRILPKRGFAIYRAPEIILGYITDHRIDVWSTALVMFEMATSMKLFTGSYNDEILHEQICTLGSFESDMINRSQFSYKYFSGTSYIKRIWKDGKIVGTKLVHCMQRNKNLHRGLFMAYKLNWECRRSGMQVTEDLDKIERFYALLRQMLTLDPRVRLPIQFVGSSEFFYDLY
ncbi:unnamed protein product [Chrysodeixis includens]|uniref:Protein kinase domain-containing protein n=1 Tax=Chrysodeixis includens TaxID=689277 RepID=A0A9P0FSX5_CHRIL|nr:unnamed protein product [Chrysodeixis includens]